MAAGLGRPACFTPGSPNFLMSRLLLLGLVCLHMVLCRCLDFGRPENCLKLCLFQRIHAALRAIAALVAALWAALSVGLCGRFCVAPGEDGELRVGCGVGATACGAAGAG